MITPFALLLNRCGLSHREAAAFLRVRLDTVKSWSSGRERVRPSVLAELRALYARIERAAAEVTAVLPARHLAAPDLIELGLASDDAEAQAIGWPCVGVHAAVVGIVAARLDLPVRIVPRASTVATAVAAAQTEQSRSRF